MSPIHSNAEGLIDFLGLRLRRLGMEDIQDRKQVLERSSPVPVVDGTYWASVNIQCSSDETQSKLSLVSD